MIYEDWMKAVDQWVWTLAGLSVYDLADCCFADWHADNVRPKTAAKRALKNSGW